MGSIPMRTRRDPIRVPQRLVWSGMLMMATLAWCTSPCEAVWEAGAGEEGLGSRVARYLGGGPCSPWQRSKVIFVRSERDIYKRTQFPSSQTVTLVLMRSLAVSKPVVFNASFSCTIFKGGLHALVYKKPDGPVLAILGAGNILVIGLNLVSSVTSSSPACPDLRLQYGRETGVRCPALYVEESWGIQYTKSSVYGRVDVFRSMQVTLDGLKATMAHNSFKVGCTEDDAGNWCSMGVIRMGQCGVGPKGLLSGNVISNCEVYNSFTLIMLYRGTLGVTVRNNFLHDYTFTGISCGTGVSSVFTCFQNTFSNNFIYVRPGAALTHEATGIYLDTNWFNPGNVFSCNYIINGVMCYYLDFSSSMVTINGGVCAGVYRGIYLNGGKYNRIKDLLIVKMAYRTLDLGGQDASTLTCRKWPGSTWEAKRKRFYNTPQYNNRWPQMRAICNPIKSNINGVNCNPRGGLPASVTGGCSGLAHGNDVDLVVVDANSANRGECRNCNGLQPTLGLLNSFTQLNISRQDVQFLGNNDYGVRRTSKVYRTYRAFRSCPRHLVGPQPRASMSYYSAWNVPRPGKLNDNINLNMDSI